VYRLFDRSLETKVSTSTFACLTVIYSCICDEGVLSGFFHRLVTND